MIALLIFFIFLSRRKRIIPSVLYEWMAITGFMCVSSVFTTQQSVAWHGTDDGLIDIRYLFIFLPFCAMCVGFAVWMVQRVTDRFIAALCIALLLCSNLLTFNIISGKPLRWPLPGYLYEIHHPYVSPYDTTISYLSAHVAKNDIIYALPTYNLSILHFYFGDSLKIGSTLSRASTLPVDVLRKAGYPAYMDEYFPNWIACFGWSQSRSDQINYFSRGPYSYILEKNIAVFWDNMIRPELPLHNFVPQKIAENSMEGIFIFKRVKKQAAITAGGTPDGVLGQ